MFNNTINSVQFSLFFKWRIDKTQWGERSTGAGQNIQREKGKKMLHDGWLLTLEMYIDPKFLAQPNIPQTRPDPRILGQTRPDPN